MKIPKSSTYKIETYFSAPTTPDLTPQTPDNDNIDFDFDLFTIPPLNKEAMDLKPDQTQKIQKVLEAKEKFPYKFKQNHCRSEERQGNKHDNNPDNDDRRNPYSLSVR